MAAGDNTKINFINIRDEVYRILHERILNHEYPPGYRFDLYKLEEQFGISRTPLKEALHRLEVEGLIQIRPRRGTYVVEIDSHDITESFDVRRILECGAAEIVVLDATDAEIAELRALAIQMSQLLESNDYQAIVGKYIELDRQFHKRLVSLAGNKRLVEAWARTDTHVQIARVRQKFTRSDSQQYTETEHEAILQALECRDVETLIKVLAEHIELSKIRTLKAIDGYA